MATPRSPEIHIQQEDLRIPPGILDLESFRRWALGPDFPERGRIDWVQGRLEVDMSPEDLNTHASPKTTIVACLYQWIQEPELGVVCVSDSRISSPTGDLSAEPDILVLLGSSIDAGHTLLIPKASGEEGRFVELEGRADLIVEIVSDSSVGKDRRHLRKAYHDAGVTEYWIVDVRRGLPRFELLIHRPGGYEPSPADEAGFRHSEVLGRSLRFARSSRRGDLVFFRLEEDGGAA